MNARDGFLKSFLHTDDYRLEPLHGDGSDRAFSRVIAAGRTYVLMEHPHGGRENRAFFAIGRHLRERSLPVPDVAAFSEEDGLALMEDLGDEHLLARVTGKSAEEKEQLYRRAVDLVIDLQRKATEGFRTEFCCDAPIYDGAFALAREGRYFLDAFLTGYLGRSLPLELVKEIEALSRRVDFDEPPVFLHRDYQSRNIMVKNDELYLIDFQGARLGPPHYDLASLVCDPYSDLESSLRDRLIDYYRQKAGYADSESFMERFLYVGVHRAMQALGAYGFLTGVKGKTAFENHMPAGVRNLVWFARRLGTKAPFLLQCGEDVLKERSWGSPSAGEC